MRKSLLTIPLIIAVLAAGALPAAGATIFIGESGNRSASAEFSLSGSTLTITLMNTAAADVLAPTDVLTGLAFQTTHALTPVSASLNGSTVYYGSTSNVGEGWQYSSGINFHGYNSGISAAGLGIFGNDQWFYNLPKTPLDGLDYGILTAGDDSSTGNTGVTGHGPLIKNAIVFTLTGANGFSLSELGGSVVFQYGTATSEPSFTGTPPVPLPPSALLLGSGLAGLGLLGSRRLKASTVSKP